VRHRRGEREEEEGKKTFSKARGNGVSYPQTLSIGASRERKHSFCIVEAISPAKPPVC
jgi:hypothetical protein